MREGIVMNKVKSEFLIKELEKVIGSASDPKSIFSVEENDMDGVREHYIMVLFDEELLSDEESELHFALKFMSHFIKVIGTNTGTRELFK